MIKYIKTTALLLALVSAACTATDEFAPTPAPVPFEGELVRTSVSLNVASPLDEQGREIVSSRAPNDFTDEEENAIRNIWIFQFAEPETAGDDDSRLLIRSVYIDNETIEAAGPMQNDIELDLYESAGQEHLLVFVANVNNGDENWQMKAGKSTYADLKGYTCLLRDDTEDARLYGKASRNILMSGATTTTIAAATPITGVVLTPSVAKINLELTLSNADYKVISIRLRNIPKYIRYFDALVPYEHFNPTIPSLIDFPVEEDIEDGLVEVGTPRSFVWYIPRYQCGTNGEISSVSDKNNLAPTNATQIEITAVNRNTGEGVRYRIYPGADMTDFNLIPNHRYLIRQNITGNGGDDPTDGRIEQFGDQMMDGNNNSFILNPPENGMAARTYHIPITRVNQYWEPDAQSNPGYGGLNEGAILSNTRWRVDLLWQDDAQMVRAQSDTPERIYISKAIGRGPDDYFSITVPAGAVHGNFVMVIRKYDPDSSIYEDSQVPFDEILWSWHFWVTDYNPDMMKHLTVNGGKFTYPVPGGQVERYGGAAWGYDTPGATVTNNWNNYAYNPASTQPYTKAFMMDRRLGALTVEYADKNTKGSVHYQFGRKDPLPGATIVYNIDGVALKAAAPDGFRAQRWDRYANGLATDVPVKMSATVDDPMRFFSGQDPYISDVDGYASGSTSVGYVWNDSKLATTGQASATQRSYEGKSIFDPCPAGWKIPTGFVWEDFRANTINRPDVFGTYQYLQHYWPLVEVDGKFSIEGRITMPSTDYRINDRNYHGSFWSNNIYYWGAIPGSSTSGRAFYVYSSTTMYTNYNISRGSALAVRCVSMEE